MRTDILEFHDFYRTPLGETARTYIAERLSEAWGQCERLDVAGFGYATPYLDGFSAARRRLAFSPGAQGIIRWPSEGKNGASLINERAWPLPDASLDRILIVHGLEEAADPQRLLREVWRVLADDGRIIIIASHRRGLWSLIDSTPFAAGQPYLKRRLNALLEQSMFRAAAWSSALFFPPVKSRFLLRAARTWERAGARAWPGLGGVLMAEATKEMLAPAGLVRREAIRAAKPAIAAPGAARFERRTGLKGAEPGGYRKGALQKKR